MACTGVTNVTKDSNCENSGGVDKIWYAPITDLDQTTTGTSEFTWDANGAISAFNFQAMKGFFTIDFDENTAFHQQVRNNPRPGVTSWTQQVQFFIGRMNNTTKEQLQKMESCANCDGIIMIILTNNQNFIVTSASYNGTEHIIKKMRPAAGATDTTGADATNDANQFQEIYEVTTPRRAVFYSGTQAAIPTPA